MKIGILAFFLAFQLQAAEVFVRIRAVGDTMLGNAATGVISNNYFQNTSSALQDADITFGNLETSLCDQNIPSTKCRANSGNTCYAFRGPTRLINDYKAAGFKILNLANNHIFDFGGSCASETKLTVANSGIMPIGLMDAPAGNEQQIMGIYEYRGKQILFMGFHYTNSNGRLVSLNDYTKVKALLQKYSPQFDMTVVSMHAGAEGVTKGRTPVGVEMHMGENRGDVRAFTHMAIDNGADLILGSGPHVLRGLEVYKNKLIVYSLGNFATYTQFNMQHPEEMGSILEAGLDETGNFVNGRIIPTYQVYDSGRTLHLEMGDTECPRDRVNVISSLEYAKHCAVYEFQRLTNLDFTSKPMIQDDGFISNLGH